MLDYLDKFNEVFQEMLGDLVKVFPSDGELRFYQMAVKAGLMTNIRIVSNIFHQSVSKTGMCDKILRMDEAFFIEKDYAEFQEKRDISRIVDKLKQCWLTLDDSNKATVWRYLKVLVLLDRKIHMDSS